jgi:hypothetical protein
MQTHCNLGHRSKPSSILASRGKIQMVALLYFFWRRLESVFTLPLLLTTARFLSLLGSDYNETIEDCLRRLNSGFNNGRCCYFTQRSVPVFSALKSFSGGGLWHQSRYGRS